MKKRTKRSRYVLSQDLLFDFIIKAGHTCFRCGDALTRDDFTIEHIVPWLGGLNEIELYFDLKNIAYSHAACNYKAARKPNKIYQTPNAKKIAQLAGERRR